MTPIDRMILHFEKRHYTRAGNKEADIVETFDMSVTRYYVLLNRLLDEPEAVAAEPVLVNRLRRIRDQRTVARSYRRAG